MKWMKISEGHYPEDGETVIVFNENENCLGAVAYFESKRKSFYLVNISELPVVITHWSYFPDKPEEEE